jgi:hypothetical protein
VLGAEGAVGGFIEGLAHGRGCNPSGPRWPRAAVRFNLYPGEIDKPRLKA